MRTVGIVLLLSGLATGVARAGDRVSMAFEGAELSEVVRRAAEATGRSLILAEHGPMAGKEVTLLVPAPVAPAEAWELALGALEASGLAATCHGAYVQVIAAKDAHGAPGCP